MSHDLRRLRLKGLLERQPASYRYQLTPWRCHVALLFAKLDARLFRRLFAALSPQPLLPAPLRLALAQVDAALDSASASAALVAIGRMTVTVVPTLT